MTRNKEEKVKAEARDRKRNKKTPTEEHKLKRCRVQLRRIKLDEFPLEKKNIDENIEKKKKMTEYVKVVGDLSLQGNIAENWRRFKRDFEIFVIASGFEDEQPKTKIARFLNAVFTTFPLEFFPYQFYINVLQNICR